MLRIVARYNHAPNIAALVESSKHAALQHCSGCLETKTTQVHCQLEVVEYYVDGRRKGMQQVSLTMVDTWSVMTPDSRSFHKLWEDTVQTCFAVSSCAKQRGKSSLRWKSGSIVVHILAWKIAVRHRVRVSRSSRSCAYGL